jgi:hypothetical protein
MPAERPVLQFSFFNFQFRCPSGANLPKFDKRLYREALSSCFGDEYNYGGIGLISGTLWIGGRPG